MCRRCIHMLMHHMLIYVLSLLNHNIIIINNTSCPIAAESPSFTMSQLSAAAQAYFNLGISAATKKAYTAGLRNYIAFCREINQQPIPACEDTLLLYVTHLAKLKLSYAMIQVYLSAVRYKCTSQQCNTVISQLVDLLP